MKNKLKHELAVCGLEAVKSLEKNNPQKIKRLYFSSEKAPLFGGLCKKLASQKIPYNQVEEKELEKICGSVHHQGIVAMIDFPKINSVSKNEISEWKKNSEHAILLDRIGNANNFGAIIRSASFFGIKNIIIPQDEKQTSVTTSSYRVAQGGMEFVNIYTCKSSSEFLRTEKENFLIIGTDLQAKKSVSELQSICKNKNAIIVLGNEEKGISESVRKLCDELIIIPAKTSIDSLNVAQASSIIFYELTK